MIPHTRYPLRQTNIVALVSRSVDSTNDQVFRDFLLKAESPAVSRALVARER
jgi:hypothetical protein